MSAVKVYFNGRVSTDPRIYDEGTEKQRLFFNVACNRMVTKSDGSKEQRTEFVSCVLWGKNRTTVLQPWLKKGRLIAVEGRFESHEVRNDDDEFVRKDWVCRIGELEFLDKKPEGVEPAKPAQTPDLNQMAQMMTQLLAQMGGGAPAAPAEAKTPAEAMEEAVPY